jgi:hypothetical protein
MSQFLINPYAFVTPIELLLDTYTGASGAYSLRKLRTAYTGSAIRVRRSNDNTEQDIGFDGNGNLDESALTTFVGANSGFVTTWYDQSGNGRDATQTTSGNQPRIVNSGTVDKIAGKPSLFFDGTAYRLSVNTLASTVTGEDKPFSVFSVAEKTNTTLGGQVLSFGRSTSATPMIQIANWLENAVFRFFIRDDGGTIQQTTSSTTYSANTPTMVSAISTGLNYKHYKDSTSLGINFNYNRGTVTLDTATIGALVRTTTSDFFGGKINEIIFYASDQSTNRTGIETNINGYYSIY